MTDRDQQIYFDEIEAWRKKMDSDLRAPDSWLSLTGLFELDDGAHSIGSADDCAVQLPASAPARLGTLVVRDKQVHLSVCADAPVFIVGDNSDKADQSQVVREADLVDDGDGARVPTRIGLGTITFFVHAYGDKIAIRVKDSANPAIQNFTGREWFSIKPDYRVPGRFVPHAEAKPVWVNTMVNVPVQYNSPGDIHFELHGQPMQLLVTSRYGNRLSILMRDATAGKSTYPAVRFLVAQVDDTDNVDVDFNKAYSPPCAFTSVATCPLPPRENILPLAIEAGERYHND